MENPPPPAQPPHRAAPAHRHVRLRYASIRADSTKLQRTAGFTDGTTRRVEMKWTDVLRVAAFRRDVLSAPVLCIAVTDLRNVVVLDESMEGWPGLLKELSKHLSESASFSQWRESIQPDSLDSYWTPLFKAVQ